jgi:hypothetical protein
MTRNESNKTETDYTSDAVEEITKELRKSHVPRQKDRKFSALDNDLLNRVDEERGRAEAWKWAFIFLTAFVWFAWFCSCNPVRE